MNKKRERKKKREKKERKREREKRGERICVSVYYLYILSKNKYTT
jgi:hypothetical protein